MSIRIPEVAMELLIPILEATTSEDETLACEEDAIATA